MLHAIHANSKAAAAFRPQTARPQDSEGALSVLPGAPATGLVGRIELVTDSNELQPALMEAVHEAKTSIKVDFHMLKGAQGQELARQLARRARQGLRVQVLAFGAATPALTEAIKVARSQGLAVRLGGEAAAANPVGRFMVVDDRLALITSLHAPARTRHARRGMLRLSGEAAGELGRQFNHDWAAAGGQPLPMLDVAALARAATYETLSTVQVGGHGPHRRAAKALVMTALLRAQRSIEVMIDVIDDAEVLDALTAAQARGVAVKVLLSGHMALERHGFMSLGRPDGQARAIAALTRAGVAVRRFHVNGQPQSVELRYALVDGETLLFGSMPWTRAGFGSAGEVMVEARGGRELLAIRAGFRHDWDNGHAVAAPSGLARVAAETAPAIAELSRVIGQFNPTPRVRSLMALEVGVMKVPGGKWKLVADAR
ncbi:cardiolipin synthetase [compost metagenome]